MVGVDLAQGRVLWSFGAMGSLPDFPGLEEAPVFGKTRPVLRVVRTGAGTTFEGEWWIPPFGGESKLIRLCVGFHGAPPAAPEGGMVSANPQHAVDLPSR